MSAAIRPRGLFRALLFSSLAIVALPGASGAQAVKHNCSFCHNLHGGSYSALSDFQVVEDLCWSCHDNAILGDTQVLRDGLSVAVPQNGYAVHDGAKHTAFSRPPTGCWDCHNHEGESDGLQGRNLSLIQASMPTPVSGTRPVIFTSRGLDAGEATLYSFADADEDGNGTYTGVCEACHTQTSNHQNGTNLPDVSNHAHERGRTCSDCHTHDTGFGGGGPCGSCHDTGGQGTTGPNTRRAVIPELSRPSHHVGSAYQDADCQVCHDMGAHQAGTVRLKNADDPGVVYALTGGDPNTVSTEAAKLTPFCLSCHDADGAGGSVPFSDGLTPPAINATAWAASSHESSAAIAGCYGNGAFGCHASGHGSLKVSLLAPATVGAGTNNVNEEEGFCNACHDGTPAVDAASSFTGAIRHPINDSEQPSGRLVECLSCHNPHVADGGSHTFSTTASSTRNSVSGAIKGVPGIDFDTTGLANFEAPALADYSAVAPATKEYQICLECHSGYAWLPGSPPAGLSANGIVTNPVMTDLAQEFSPQNRSGHPIVTGLDNYPNSTAVGSPARKGLVSAVMKAPWNTNLGSQTMMCSDCHNTDAASPAAQGPHGSAVDFMLRGPNTNWPGTVDFQNTDLPTQYANGFCGNCHVYSQNNDPHSEHDTRRNVYCYSCHIVVPHGGKLSRLIADNDAMPVRYAYGNTLNTNFVQGFTKRAQSSYSKADCRAQCTSAHRNTTPSENWN